MVLDLDFPHHLTGSIDFRSRPCLHVADKPKGSIYQHGMRASKTVAMSSCWTPPMNYDCTTTGAVWDRVNLLEPVPRDGSTELQESVNTCYPDGTPQTTEYTCVSDKYCLLTAGRAGPIEATVKVKDSMAIFRVDLTLLIAIVVLLCPSQGCTFLCIVRKTH